MMLRVVLTNGRCAELQIGDVGQLGEVIGALDTSAALVEFSPASAKLQIRSTPEVGSGSSRTGSNIPPPLGERA
jgi:hypothetical protein